MPRYELGVTSTVAASGGIAAEFRVPAGRSAQIRLIEIFLGAATASLFGIGRSAVLGVGGTVLAGVPSDNNNDPTSGAGVVVGGQTTPPTAPGTYARRPRIPGAIGNGYGASFPDGLYAPASSSLVIVNLQLNAATIDFNIIWDE